jgi:hypothetical protein
MTARRLCPILFTRSGSVVTLPGVIPALRLPAAFDRARPGGRVNGGRQ